MGRCGVGRRISGTITRHMEAKQEHEARETTKDERTHATVELGLRLGHLVARDEADEQARDNVVEAAEEAVVKVGHGG